jgi:hypothetical protein
VSGSSEGSQEEKVTQRKIVLLLPWEHLKFNTTNQPEVGVGEVYRNNFAGRADGLWILTKPATP